MGKQKGNDQATSKPTRPTVKHGRLAYFPAAAIDDSRVDYTMLAVLAALSSHCSRSGYADVSAAALGARLGLERSWVSKRLTALERLGYLKSVRRTLGDGRETSKAYKLILDYVLPPQFWRYLPSDYGAEPEESILDALFDSTPPVLPVSTPPVLPVSTPPVLPVSTPPVLPVSTRTIGINDIDVSVVNGAQARECLPLNFAQEIATAAKLGSATNLEALAELLQDTTAAGLTPNDLRIVAGDCADWYAANRHTTPRLGNFAEWLRREKRRRALEAREEAQEDAKQAAREAAREEVANHDATDATAGPSASATDAPAGRSRRALGGSSDDRRQTSRARRDASGRSRASRQRDRHTEPSGRDEALYGDWEPGHRAFVPDDPSNPDGEWGYVITESGRRVRYSQVSGYVNPAEAYDSEQGDRQEEEPDAAARASRG